MNIANRFLAVFLVASAIFPLAQAAPPITEPVDAIIVNDETIPVPVVTVNPPATIDPYQLALSFDQIDAGSLGRSFFEDVEEGKLAILDHVSFRVALPSGQVARATLICQGAGLSKFDIAMAFNGTFNGRSLYTADTPIQCYARGAGSIVGGVIRNSDAGNTGEVAFSFSAHLVDDPDG